MTQQEPKAGSDEDQKIAGGDLIPFLLSLVDKVLQRLNYKKSFWVLVLLAALPRSLSIGGFLAAFGRTLVILLAAFFALVASYYRPPSPFPACKKRGLDILMGRSVQVSKDDGLPSNNNVSMVCYKGTYVLAYRKSDVHFPSGATIMKVVTSENLEDWEERFSYKTGHDLREMLLFEMGGRLFLYFFSLIPEGKVFKPIHMYCTTSDDAKTWNKPHEVCKKSEVPWDIKVYREANGKEIAYKASYLGDHYGTDEVCVLFEKSTDGLSWEPVGEEGSVVYRGGVCEVAFEFTKKGDLVALGRNEDGDHTGFGTQLYYAPKENLGCWTSLSVSLPWRFDSPRMMRTDGGDGELLLFSRYAPNKYQLAPEWLPFMYQKVFNLVSYSCLPKSAAIFRIAPPEEWSTDGKKTSVTECPMQLVRFFEQAFGDTGFFSLTREKEKKPDEWVVANYSSYCNSHAPWIYGQQTESNIFVQKCFIQHS